MKAPKFLWFFLVTAAIIVVPTAVNFLKEPRLFANVPFASNYFFGNLYVPHIVSNLILFFHILVAVPAFLLGPFMFHEGLRNKYIKLHIAGGTIYVIGAMGCGLTGLFLGSMNTQGLAAKLGFGTLGTLLFLTTLTAYKAARRKKFVEHRVWMIRSYSLMFAFFFVKFLFLAWGFYFHDKVNPDLYKQILSWACWVFNLGTAELYIAITSATGGFVGWKNIKDNYFKNRLFKWKPVI